MEEKFIAIDVYQKNSESYLLHNLIVHTKALDKQEKESNPKLLEGEKL